MKTKKPRRIAIIGLPGSGKSTFAAKLGKLLDIPVFHLDKYVFTEDNKKRDHQEFVTMQQKMVEQEHWIIEGCSIKTLDIRFARADTVLYLQLPRLFCLRRVLMRPFIFDDHVVNSGCLNRASWALLKYTWNFHRDKNPEIQGTKNRHPHLDFHVLTTPRDVENYLKTRIF